MASNSSVAQLYAITTRLTFFVTRLSIDLPFPLTASNEVVLFKKGNDLGKLAAKMRAKDPAMIASTLVTSITKKVQVAQALIDYINNHPNNTLTAAEVIEAVASAIAEIKKL